MTNRELETVYCGAYFFRETEDGWLQAFQYSKEQMDYFESCIAKGIDFWYDRCMASTAKTLEMTTSAGTISFEYRFIWTGSQDSFELAVNGQITDIRYVRDLPKEGNLVWSLPEGEKEIIVYLPADGRGVLVVYLGHDVGVSAELLVEVLFAAFLHLGIPPSPDMSPVFMW